MLVIRHATVGPFAMNAWLAGCDRTGEAVLIDPGDEISRVVALAEPGGFRVTRIVLTHGHVDHAAGAAEAAAPHRGAGPDPRRTTCPCSSTSRSRRR